MFSVQQKREIADAVQKILRETNHPELPDGEIVFRMLVEGADAWCFAQIQNNGAVIAPGVNPWNEKQDPRNNPVSDSHIQSVPTPAELIRADEEAMEKEAREERRKPMP